MHPEAYTFLEQTIRRLFPIGCQGLHVVEFGSRDVNGTPRPLFAGASYVGVDIAPGPGVDVVADAAEYEGAPADVVVCAETLEHTPHPERLIASARRVLKPGGWLILTAAAPPRAPHGCTADGSMAPGEYYANIEPERLKAWLRGWEYVAVSTHPHGDVYAAAQR